MAYAPLPPDDVKWKDLLSDYFDNLSLTRCALDVFMPDAAARDEHLYIPSTLRKLLQNQWIALAGQ